MMPTLFVRTDTGGCNWHRHIPWKEDVGINDYSYEGRFVCSRVVFVVVLIENEN